MVNIISVPDLGIPDHFILLSTWDMEVWCGCERVVDVCYMYDICLLIIATDSMHIITVYCKIYMA